VDPGVVELAGRVFDLARGGRTADLAGYLDAGVPGNLTNGSGDTLLVLAAYHGHPDTVALLLARGADPDLGRRSGRATAAFCDLPGMAALLPGRRREARIAVLTCADAECRYPGRR
jgi:hypothetical protein